MGDWHLLYNLYQCTVNSLANCSLSSRSNDIRLYFINGFETRAINPVSTCACTKPFPKIVPMVKLDISSYQVVFVKPTNPFYIPPQILKTLPPQGLDSFTTQHCKVLLSIVASSCSQEPASALSQDKPETFRSMLYIFFFLKCIQNFSNQTGKTVLLIV